MLKIHTLIIHRRGSSLILPLLLVCSLLSGCASWLPDAHRPDLTQGNAIKPEDLAKLQPGMNRSKVIEIIGNPTLIDPFHAERWDYIYRYIPGRGKAEQSRVSLFFDGDVLKRIDKSGYTPPVERNMNGQGEADHPAPPDRDRDTD
jgi:outer membrane protein assembly factor BamE